MSFGEAAHLVDDLYAEVLGCGQGRAMEVSADTDLQAFRQIPVQTSQQRAVEAVYLFAIPIGQAMNTTGWSIGYRGKGPRVEKPQNKDRPKDSFHLAPLSINEVERPDYFKKQVFVCWEDIRVGGVSSAFCCSSNEYFGAVGAITEREGALRREIVALGLYGPDICETGASDACEQGTFELYRRLLGRIDATKVGVPCLNAVQALYHLLIEPFSLLAQGGDELLAHLLADGGGQPSLPDVDGAT